MSGVITASENTRSLSEVAPIVHDPRNPLAAIHGSAEILVRSRVSQSQGQRIARNMYRASVRMGELLEEFPDQSQGAERLELSDVHGLVASAVDQIAGSAELQSVHIVQAIPEGSVIALDRRMRRVLINLLDECVGGHTQRGNRLQPPESRVSSAWASLFHARS